jgi:hypothetical protein
MGLDDLQLDKQTWLEVKSRIVNKITNADYKILCQLHAKYFNHKYKEPCTCNKENLRNWIKEVDNKLNI